MTRVAVLLAGLVFPPLIVVGEGNRRVLAIAVAVQAAILLAFFQLFWGPAFAAHMLFWSVLALRRGRPRQVTAAGRS